MINSPIVSLITLAIFSAVSFVMSSKDFSGNSHCGLFTIHPSSLKSVSQPTGTITTLMFLEHSSSDIDERIPCSSSLPSAFCLPLVINTISWFCVGFNGALVAALVLKCLAASFNAKSILLNSLLVCGGRNTSVVFGSNSIVSAFSPYTTRAGFKCFVGSFQCLEMYCEKFSSFFKFSADTDFEKSTAKATLKSNSEPGRCTSNSVWQPCPFTAFRLNYNRRQKCWDIVGVSLLFSIGNSNIGTTLNVGDEGEKSIFPPCNFSKT